MKTLIVTGYDDSMALIGDLCASTHRAYAARHGYEFETVREYPPHCHPSWHKLSILKERLPRFDRIAWFDADSVITNPTITLDSIAGNHQGLTVSKDWSWPLPEDEMKHFSLGNFILTNCPGSFAILDAAQARTEWANAKLWEQQAIQEEYRANPSIRPHIQVLPRRALNAVPATETTTGPEPWQPGDFLCHLTFLSQQERCDLFPRYTAEAIKISLPNLPAWHETGMCADARHIAILQEILCTIPFSSGLEIGTWTGCSTVAFVAALKSGSLGKFTACDVGFTNEFRAIIEGHPVILENHTSAEVLSGNHDFDVVFVDGDHSLQTGIAETELLLRRPPRVIIAHDYCSTLAGFPNCEGPAHMFHRLKTEGWHCITDAKNRPQEMTHRGFFAATRDNSLLPALRRAFAVFS